MTLRLIIDCDNAAFTDNGGKEVARILRKLADRADDCQVDDLDQTPAMDFNGNRVGTVHIFHEGDHA